MTSVASPRRGLRFLEFLAVGGLTPLLFPLSWAMQTQLGLDAAELLVGFTMFHLAHVINDPHFAVTYLLFYEDVRGRLFGDAFNRPQRIRYALAGVVAPIALLGWLLWALYAGDNERLGMMVQLMFLLVGWHYVKQGFGVALVLSARRGVRYAVWERRVLLAHCYAGWAYAWANPWDPGRALVEKGLVYHTFTHPSWIEPVALCATLVTGIALLGMLARKRLREETRGLLTPVTALLCSIWAWLIYSGIDPLVRYVVPALHGVQYLYFVQLLKGNQARERQGAPWFEASVGTRLAVLSASALALGFVLFDVLPDVMDTSFAPRSDNDDLGPTPWMAAIATFVNLHHYFMDSVIWRRDNPETRYLTK